MASHWIQWDVIDYLINFLSSSNNSTLQEAVPEVGASRRRYIVDVAEVAEENCGELNGKIQTLHFEETDIAKSFLVFNLRGCQSLLNMFTEVVTYDLINEVMANRNPIFDHQQESSADSDADVTFVIEVSGYFDLYSGITGKTIGEYEEFPSPSRKHQKMS